MNYLSVWDVSSSRLSNQTTVSVSENTHLSMTPKPPNQVPKSGRLLRFSLFSTRGSPQSLTCPWFRNRDSGSTSDFGVFRAAGASWIELGMFWQSNHTPKVRPQSHTGPIHHFHTHRVHITAPSRPPLQPHLRPHGPHTPTRPAAAPASPAPSTRPHSHVPTAACRSSCPHRIASHQRSHFPRQARRPSHPKNSQTERKRYRHRHRQNQKRKHKLTASPPSTPPPQFTPSSLPAAPRPRAAARP